MVVRVQAVIRRRRDWFYGGDGGKSPRAVNVDVSGKKTER